MSIPQSIGRYRIQGLLGTGAMGEVYRGHDPSIDRLVAIKVLRPELITGSGAADGFTARLRWFDGRTNDQILDQTPYNTFFGGIFVG